MLYIPKITIPTTKEEDMNASKTTWVNDRYVMLDLGKYVNLYLLPETYEEEITNENGENITRTVTSAFEVRVKKPFNKKKIIDAAERTAYMLKTDADSASFTAGLSRRYRENNNDERVLEHDAFIREIKEDIKKINLYY